MSDFDLTFRLPLQLDKTDRQGQAYENAFRRLQGILNRLETRLNVMETVILQNQAAGIQTGGVLSIVNSSTGQLTAGCAIIMDFSNPKQPIRTLIDWPTIQFVVLDLSASSTSIALDKAANLIQFPEAKVTTAEEHTHQLFGGFQHAGGNLVNLVNQPRPVGYDLQGFLTTFIRRVIGPARIDGLEVTPAGANLKLEVQAGIIFLEGANFHNNPAQPHELAVAGQDPANLFLVHRDPGDLDDVIIQLPQVTDINATQYDDGTGLVSIGAANFVNHRIFVFQGGGIAVSYAQQTYANMDDAVAGAPTESYEERPIMERSVFLAWLVVRGGTTDLTDVARAKIIISPNHRANR